MIIKLLIVFIMLFTIFWIVNMALYIRSKNHSNKALEKIILKFPFNLFLKPYKQGWTILTFKTSKPLEQFNTINLPQKSTINLADKDCSGLADPFLFKEDSNYYLFFEYEYHKYLKKGADIAYATSKNGIDWVYQKKILQEPFHQSYPYVFKKDENFYMLPESYQSNQVRLYKAKNFPENWVLDTVLFEGVQFVDTIFVEVDAIYYWITTNLISNELLLFYSENLKAPWIKHPCSPLTNYVKNNRNAGPIIKYNCKLYRVAQDGTKGYGSGINLYQILEISKTNYVERAIKEPLFFKKSGIFKDAVHQLSILNENGTEKLVALDGANFAMNKIIIK